MRKSTLLKLMGTCAAVMFSFGVMAQVADDYTATQITEPTMYQTQGTNFMLYVQPDAVYSPSYDHAAQTGINANSYWTFTITAGLTLVQPASIAAPVNQNWVELTATTTGAQTITATERFGLAGCISSTVISQVVNVVAAPSAVMNGVDASATAAGFTVATPLRSYYICGSGTATDNIDLSVIATEIGVPTDLAHYSYAIVQRKIQIDNSGAEVGAPVLTTVVDHLIGSKVGGAYAAGVTTITETDVVPSANLTFIAADTRTKVQYYLASTAGVTTGSGLVSAVSHKSDYVSGAVTGYTFDADAANYTVEFILNLPPTTGPIYHIPNAFRY